MIIALEHKFLLLLLLLVVTFFNYNDITGNKRETNMFILVLPQEKDAEEKEEVNDGIVGLFFIFISKPVPYPPPPGINILHT